MIELEIVFFMEPLLLKVLHRYFPPDGKLFIDVKMKIWYSGKRKKSKTETGTRLLQRNYTF